MITDLLVDLKDFILSQNAVTFQKGFALVQQYQDGRVVAYAAGEGTYVGISDLDCNFFYIRLFDDAVTYAEVDEDKKLSACTMYQGTGTLRLFAWVISGDFDRMSKVLINDILAHDYEATTGFDRVETPIITTVTHQPETIFKQETLFEDERVRLDRAATIIAIDFTLTFANTLDSEECENRNLCVDQCS